MSTAFASTNAFNLAETATVVCINGNAWLGSTANVKTVHTKIRTGEDLHALYYPYELPAIGVQTLGGGPDDKHTTGEFLQSYQVGFDVWATGPTFSTADTTLKEIMAQLRRLLRLQTFSPTVESESNQLDTFAANGEIEVQSCDFEHFPAEDGGWLVHGVTMAIISIISEE
jgi:hypothetical protein